MDPEDEPTPGGAREERGGDPSEQADEPTPTDPAADQEGASGAGAEQMAKTLEALQARVERGDRDALRGTIEGESDQANPGDRPGWSRQ